MLLSAVLTHSDGTHSLQMIQWAAKDAKMIHYFKSVPIKKRRKKLNLRWPEGKYIFSKVSCMGKLFHKVFWTCSPGLYLHLPRVSLASYGSGCFHPALSNICFCNIV